MGPNSNIVCTQPRRLAAITLAQRVASERCESAGAQVGYSVRLESKTSADTQLLFCTTGVLLRHFLSDPTAKQFTHIILDEVHERDKFSDFLMMLLKRILPTRCTTKSDRPDPIDQIR
jgi:HrpA-like RNA helicase